MTESETLTQLLEDAADRHASRPALIDGSSAFTYAEFAALARRTAAWLAKQGIGPGDRVALWLPNRLEWLVLFFALARLGATTVAVNTRFRSAELTYLLSRSAASCLVLQPGFRKIDFRGVLADVDPARLPALRRAIVLDADTRDPGPILSRPALPFALADLPARDGPDCATPDAPAILFTTSGTTRGPKLVVHSQRTIALHAQDVARRFGFDAPDARLLAMLPLCGTFGLAAALGSFAGGAPIVVLDAFDAAAARELLRTHAVTHSFGSDEMFERILALCPEERPFPQARLFGYAAFQPGAQAFAARACARGLPMRGLYGSSEVQALFAAQPGDLPVEQRLQGGGRPVAASAAVRIRDVDGDRLLPPGETGEIEIRAPRSAFTHYLDDPEATAAAIDGEGFFRTGDLGFARREGSFVFETRRGDVMRIGGHLVSPAEIEDVIEAMPGVTKAQVVAVAIGGSSRPVAFVIRAAGAAVSADDIVARAAGAMAGFKVPARVWFVESFPVTESANGVKIQRGRLRETALERLAREEAEPARDNTDLSI